MSELRPKSQGSRAFDVLFPLLVAGVMLVAALPRDYLGPLADAERCGDGKVSCKSWIAKSLRQVSVSQRWGMYAPAPQRSHAYMLLTAVDADGTERPLFESQVAADGWGTAWAWQKSRLDILRHAVGYFKANKPNRNRMWFMRGVCVREARAGRNPITIRMDQVRRRFTPPKKVAAGKPVLRKQTVKKVQTVHCDAKYVRTMIEEDRGGE